MAGLIWTQSSPTTKMRKPFLTMAKGMTKKAEEDAPPGRAQEEVSRQQTGNQQDLAGVDAAAFRPDHQGIQL